MAGITIEERIKEEIEMLETMSGSAESGRFYPSTLIRSHSLKSVRFIINNAIRILKALDGICTHCKYGVCDECRFKDIDKID